MSISRLVRPYLFAFVLLGTSPLLAEFQQIQIKWTSGLCGTDCIKNLQIQFSKIPGFKQASFGNSQVTLQWQPGYPFTFSSINTATRMVGIRLWEVRIKVKGKVYHDKDQFFLKSDGDGTIVQLLGGTAPSPTGNTVVPNIATHGLNPSMQTKLFEAEKDKTSIVVEGPLFQPFQMPNLRVIVANLRAGKQANEPGETEPTPGTTKGSNISPTGR